MIITAKVIKSFPISNREHNGKTYTSREIEVVTGGNYPDTFKVKFEGDNVALIKTLDQNQSFDFHTNVRGRKWVKGGKEYYFTDFICWKITPSEAQAVTTPQVTAADLEEDLGLPF